DLHGDLRQRVELDLLALELELPFVHVARITFGTGDRDVLPFADGFRGISAAHDRGDAELARDDGRVARAPAAIRDDGGRALHDRLPVGIGHVRDEHVAALHARHVLHVLDDAGRARADALTDAAARGEDLRPALQ